MKSGVKTSQAASQVQEWFTPAEAARYLRVSRKSIYNYMEQGLLKYHELKSGGGRRLRRADLDAFLEEPSLDDTGTTE